MEMRPSHRAALVRALPVFVCRGLFLCGVGEFPKRPSARPPMAEALGSSWQGAVRIRHIPIRNEGDGGLLLDLVRSGAGPGLEKVLDLVLCLFGR